MNKHFSEREVRANRRSDLCQPELVYSISWEVSEDYSQSDHQEVTWCIVFPGTLVKTTAIVTTRSHMAEKSPGRTSREQWSQGKSSQYEKMHRHSM